MNVVHFSLLTLRYQQWAHPTQLFINNSAWPDVEVKFSKVHLPCLKLHYSAIPLRIISMSLVGLLHVYVCLSVRELKCWHIFDHNIYFRFDGARTSSAHNVVSMCISIAQLLHILLNEKAITKYLLVLSLC